MSDDMEEDARDVQCGTNLRAFHDIRTWSYAVKPWSEFFRCSQLSLPYCIDGYIKRMKKNFNRFSANYAVVTTILLFCGIITSFWLMVSCIVLGIFIYAIYTKTRNGPVRIGVEEIPSWILYATAIFITLPLFIYAGVGYILYCAAGIGIFLVIMHASFYGNEPSLHLPEVNIELVTEVNNQSRTVEVTQNEPLVPKSRVRFDEAGDIDE
ncbi:unnamed protein product [Gongylonema pulchrum]|uniref:PRA1 family protein n=1 Tax=Gongylonema pulchrum TaxID=637853 RepID=A0A183CUW3_9BILA|nr:unnamed protein product [Gongylonema pulchrum]